MITEPPEELPRFSSPEEVLEHFGIKGMRWGFRKEREHISGFDSFGTPYDPQGSLQQGIKEFQLKHPDQLRVDISQGFADVRSNKGFRSEQARKNYESVTDEVHRLREQYPAVANVKLEVVPMSHIPGHVSANVQAAVMHGKHGEVTIAYNDNSKDFSERSAKAWEQWVPGMQYPGYAGRHEMGHVLAAAKNMIPTTAPLYDNKNKSLAKHFDDLDKYNTNLEDRHKAAMSRAGLSYKDLHILGNYAKTSPSEAYAEAYGHYHTPQLRTKLAPELEKKIKALLNDKGDKS